MPIRDLFSDTEPATQKASAPEQAVGEDVDETAA